PGHRRPARPAAGEPRARTGGEALVATGPSALRRTGQGGAGAKALGTAARTRAGRDPGQPPAPLRPGGAPRRAAHLPDDAAGVLLARRHGYRPLPGIGAVSRRRGGGAARKPRPAMAVRGLRALLRVDR